MPVSTRSSSDIITCECAAAPAAVNAFVNPDALSIITLLDGLQDIRMMLPANVHGPLVQLGDVFHHVPDDVHRFARESAADLYARLFGVDRPGAGYIMQAHIMCLHSDHLPLSVPPTSVPP